MARQPNIILINCDDLGFGDLGCYGSEVNDTPHLDRLAAEGTRFTEFYMASPVCSPSRGAMMCGCYPPRIGFDKFTKGWVLFPGSPEGLSTQETTFARSLKDAGYATQIVGKWHCGDQKEFLPTRHGFDHYYGLPYSNDMGRQKDRCIWPPLPLMRDEEVIEAQPDMASLTQRYVEESLRFMRDNKDGPFLLYFAHMYVHLPLIVPEHLAVRSRNGRYGAAVMAIDWATGMLMAELDRLGIADDTLILFTSDNGSKAGEWGGSNGELRGTKGTTFEGGQRLPLIARWPGKVPAGRVCEELCASLDLLPTFATLAGSSLGDKQIDGLDVSELLLGGDTSPREYFAYFFQSDLDAIRDQRFKLHIGRANRDVKPWGREAICELYDLKADPGETSNVAAEHPEVVARLQAAAAELNAKLGPDGSERRPVGMASQPCPLTEYDEKHPYFAAEYDLSEAG
ncbi:MAG: sulfatase [Planctomycetota bacterium]|jgi:arylsulfatase A|nr:sulfatase [Planctomycetota bacterium]